MPDPAADAALTVDKFDKAPHDRSAFSCGHGPIDNFLKSSLSDQIRSGVVTAYMATERGGSDVIGFHTLGAPAVRADSGPERWRRARMPDVPLIHIRVVAVREDRQGKGIGAALVVDALRKCLAISDRMGAAAVVLDAPRDDRFERRWAFYERLGFRALDAPDNPGRAFISMADVRATLGG